MAVAARATTYDLQGNVITSFPVVASGDRLQVERIPDEPQTPSRSAQRRAPARLPRP